MTISERKFLHGIPLGREKIVRGTTEVQEPVYADLFGKLIVDRVKVDGENDMIIFQRMTRDSSGYVSEQRPSVLVQDEINGAEQSGLVVQTGRRKSTVFRYIAE
jgi:hypothetical protein